MVFTKRLLLLLLAAALAVLMIVPGCDKEEMSEEELKAIDKIADELIEEGAPTTAPTPKPTPTPTPKLEPTPTPTPEKVGMLFSDELLNMCYALWPVKSTPVDAFGSDYAVFCDNGPSGGENYLTFRFMPGLTVPEIQQQVTPVIFGETINEMHYTGSFINETDENGDPLTVTFDIKEKDDGAYYYIGFMPSSKITVVDEVLKKHYPENGIVDKELTEDKLFFEGFGVDRQSGGFVLYKMWDIGCPDITMNIFNSYKKFNGEEDYELDESDPNMPRVSFTYDLTGDGKGQCTVNAEAVVEPMFFRLKLRSNLEF